MDLEAFFPSKDRFALAMQLNQLLAAPGFAAWLQGDPLDLDRLLYTAEGKPRVAVDLDRAPRRPRADVLRLAAPEPARGLDAGPARHLEPPRTGLLRRDLRVPPAGGESAVQGPAAEAAEAGPGVRHRPVRGDPEPGGPGLQGALQLRHVAAGAPPDRAGQGARARRPRGRGGELGRGLRSRQRSTSCSPRSASASSCCTTCTRSVPRCSRPAGRCRTCAGRWDGTRFGG